MRTKSLKTIFIVVDVALLAIALPLIHSASASPYPPSSQISVVPFTFVGAAGDCGTGYPAGSRIVTSAWLCGFGLPDNGGPNAVPNAPSPTANDPHRGLLLSKNGPTDNCSSAGATVTGVANTTFTATYELGFDFRNGTHCGAGAPRFNVVTSDNVTHFFGCAGGTQTPAPQDPLEWTRVRFTAAQGFPPVMPGSTISSISIIYDEGTDTPSTQDPNGVGLANLDNIDINGFLVTQGPVSGGCDQQPSHGYYH